ncbi:MAG TPA: NHL repeat-containing protein [Candidatus Binataceae bacterium]|nr:NHL repeat-containing protein [Candidatus Binataceae bacterium]
MKDSRGKVRIAAAVAMFAAAFTVLAVARLTASRAQLAVSPTSRPTTGIFVSNELCNNVTAYPVGSNGNVAPIFPVTGLSSPGGIARDANGRIYVANWQSSTITVYAPGSSGQVTPIATIGGDNTGLRGLGGIALDSGGNIYVGSQVNGGGGILVFAANVNGNVAPIATISGSNTGIGLNSPVGVAVDSSGIIYLANFDGGPSKNGSVTVYPAGSNGNVTPIATISGSGTGLDLGPTGIAVDSSGNIYVTNSGFQNDRVTVYSAGSDGNATPIATISGSNTEITSPAGIAVDSSGNIYVALPIMKPSGGINVFAAGSNGNVAPMATISGSNTEITSPAGIAVDSSGNIYVTNNGNNSLHVYPAGSNGNVTPTATISDPYTGIDEPGGIALDSSGNIYVANFIGGLSASVTIYASGSYANTAPIATIAGENTGLNQPFGIAVDSSGNIYVTNSMGDSVTVYAPGSNGNVTPIATIQGPNTGLDVPYSIAVDSAGNIYVTNLDLSQLSNDSVTVYPAGSNGNVAPIATISGSNTGIEAPDGIAVDSSGNIYVALPIMKPSGGINVFAAGSNGNVAPIATIAGASTGFSGVYGIALDPTGKIYVSTSGSVGGVVSIFPAGSNGDVAPVGSIDGPNTELCSPNGISIFSGPPTPTLTTTPTVTATPTAIITATPTVTATPTGTTTATPTATPTEVPEVILVLPRKYNFGKVAADSVSRPVNVVITNLDAKHRKPVLIETIESGANFPIIENQCPVPPAQLAFKQLCTVEVACRGPAVHHIVTGTLTVTDNSIGSSQSVALSCTGK